MKSEMVLGKGLEPSLPCENTPVKRTRIPIPPPELESLSNSIQEKGQEDFRKLLKASSFSFSQSPSDQ